MKDGDDFKKMLKAKQEARAAEKKRFEDEDAAEKKLSKATHASLVEWTNKTLKCQKLDGNYTLVGRIENEQGRDSVHYWATGANYNMVSGVVNTPLFNVTAFGNTVEIKHQVGSPCPNKKDETGLSLEAVTDHICDLLTDLTEHVIYHNSHGNKRND